MYPIPHQIKELNSEYINVSFFPSSLSYIRPGLSVIVTTWIYYVDLMFTNPQWVIALYESAFGVHAQAISRGGRNAHR